jgi:hypothetical protein
MYFTQIKLFSRAILGNLLGAFMGLGILLALGFMPIAANVSVYLFYCLAILSLIQIVLTYYSGDTIRLNLSWRSPELWLLVLLAWSGLSLYWTLDFHYTFHDWLEFLVFCVAVLAITRSGNALNLNDYLRFSLPVITIVAVIFSLDRYFNYVLTDAFHANARGFYPKQPLQLLILYFISLSTQFNPRTAPKSSHVTLGLICLGAVMTAVMTSESDTTKVTLLLTGLFALGAQYLSKQWIMRLLIALFLSISLASLFIAEISTSVIQTLHLTSLIKDSGFDRIHIWTAYETIVEQKLFFGWGLKSASLMQPMIGYAGYPHNTFLQIWVELGLAGIIIVNILFASLINHISNILDEDQFYRACVIIIATLISLLTAVRLMAFWYWYVIIIYFWIFFQSVKSHNS